MSKRKWKGESEKKEEDEDKEEDQPCVRPKLQRPMTGTYGMDSDQGDFARWTQEVYDEHRSTLKRKYQHLNEGVPNPKDMRSLNEIYTELLITEEVGVGLASDEHEVRQIERASWREAASKPIKCNDIFSSLSGQNRSIRTVLTKGVAGVGKTVSVQKFILDWAEGKANQDVHFIFPLPFRELNLINTKLSLVELLKHFFPNIKDSQIFTSLEHKVMFIFDGLDECRFSLHFHSNLKFCDVTEPASVDVLLTNLIEGDLLPSALLWITTRPAAANQIPPDFLSRVTEIRGFIDPQKDEYFRKRINNENLAHRTITHLKSSRTLYIMCHIPVFCWVVATVVQRTSDESETVEIPRTLTQMYTHFLIVQTIVKKTKYSESTEMNDDMIYKLGKLAFQQLEKGNLIFYEEDLRECGINVTEASVYSGVCTQIFREESRLYQGKVFSFVHLSIQEFLAALYVLLCFNNRKRKQPSKQQISRPPALFRARTVLELHKTAVELSLQSLNGHLDLFLRFLLGLSLESVQILLIHLLPQTKSDLQSSVQTVQYIKQKIRNDITSDRRINLFYCLNELNQHAIVEEIDRNSGALSVVMLLPGEWQTKTFEFKISKEHVDDFDLQKYIKTPEKDLTEILNPDEVLQRLVPAVTSALLRGCSLTHQSCAALATAARLTSFSLNELDLSENVIQDAGVYNLSNFLKNPHCKMEKLVLRGCSLTEKSCNALASATSSSSSSLRVLDLSYNYELLDAGVQHLSNLLKNPLCKLEKLVLEHCSLTERSCAAIASAASSTACILKELNLSGNNVLDLGVEHLSHLLKNAHCKLEKLELQRCSLTEKSCAALASAGRSNPCSLKELNLGLNELLDAGVQHLSDLLNNPHCKLEKLNLERCSLREKSCFTLASVVSAAWSRLKELNLSLNVLLDAGVEHLSNILKAPCTLEKLWLSDCFLTEKSCAVLVSANRAGVKELNLSYNDIYDKGVQHLSDLFKNPHCKLEKLQLSGCSLTEKSCAALASASSSNSCSLKELNLSYNMLHDAGVQHLSDLLKNPHCKLEKLVLQHCSLSQKSCGVLTSAVSIIPCSLKELNLNYNHEINHTGVQCLSNLLKNPYCRLEKLEVDGQIFRKESSAAVDSTSSSYSWDVAELQFKDKAKQDSGAQLLSFSDTFKEDYPSDDPQMGHEPCADVSDSRRWVLVKPEVSTEKSISTYSLSSPAGSHECSESGLRWSCAAPVTLQYCFTDWHLLADELPHMQYRPAGPSMDVKLISGELEEIYLPHFLCLVGSQSSLKNAVKVLHKEDSGVFIEECELGCFHARLVNPSFSVLGVFLSLKSFIFPGKEKEKLIEIHADVQVYQSSTSPLTFRTYLLPEDAHLRMLVKEQEKSEEFRGFRLAMPRPVKRLQMNGFYGLQTSCTSSIYPTELDLRYSEIVPNFSVVRISDACDFKMELLCSVNNQQVWQADILRTECWNKPQQDNMNTCTYIPDTSHPSSSEAANIQISEAEIQRTTYLQNKTHNLDEAEFLKEKMPDLIQKVTNVMALADEMLSKDIIKKEQYMNIKAEPIDQCKMRSVFDALRSCGSSETKLFFRILLNQHSSLLRELGWD